MPTQEDIKHQQDLLSIHRKNLAIRLKQRSLHGPGAVPPLIEHEIDDARTNIVRIKGILRGWKQEVADEPDDEEPAPQAAVRLDPTPGAQVSDQPVDFVIGAALEEELDAVLEKLPGYRQIDPSQDDIRVYYAAQVPVTLPSGATGAYEVRALLLGKGQEDATLAAADALRRWKPGYMLIVGIAGGVAANGVSLGDVLVADQIVGYELQKLTAKRIDVRWNVHPVNTALVLAARNFRGSSWQQLLTAERPTAGTPRRHIGPIASGNKVIAYGRVVERYRDVWSQLVGVEMEAAGVAAAAFQQAQPARFFMVRGASDLADDAKDSQEVKRWRTYACDVAASYAIALLRSGPVPLPNRAIAPQAAPGVSAGQPPAATGAATAQDLAPAARLELAGLLENSGRAAYGSRSALCIEIGIDSGRLTFMQESPHDFAVQLVAHLHRTGNIAALRQLCEAITPYLDGQPAARLEDIRAKLG